MLFDNRGQQTAERIVLKPHVTALDTEKQYYTSHKEPYLTKPVTTLVGETKLPIITSDNQP